MRAVSLSQDPAFSVLKNYMVCGYKDISGEPYAGMSGRHEREGRAVNTTNGAGPHNIQMFILSSDGVVLMCLPGYWSPQDLITEVRFAAQVDQVWKDKSLTKAQKDQMFTKMHMAHLAQHPRGMVNRSHLQGFDAKYEAEKPHSDAIKHPEMLASAQWGEGGHLNMAAFKTTDEIMHDRMAQRPFMSYNRFDVASFSDYGKWRYDKEEDARMADGSVDHEKARNLGHIGDPESEKMHRKWTNASESHGTASSGWGNNGWGGK